MAVGLQLCCQSARSLSTGGFARTCGAATSEISSSGRVWLGVFDGTG